MKTLLLLCALFGTQKAISAELKPLYNFTMSNPNKYPTLDSGIFRLGKDTYSFLAFFVDLENAKKNNAFPLLIYKVNKNSKLQHPSSASVSADLVLSVKPTEHIRNFKTLNTPWGEGILFADHGLDHQGFFNGGIAKLVVLNKITGKLEDMSAKLAQKRNFVFNVVAVKKKNNPYDDIILVPYNTDFSFPVYLQATKTGYVDKTDQLPPEWKSKSVCYMTGISYDLEKDGNDEVLLGGCDQDTKYNPTIRDRFMKYSKNKWSFMDENIFPLRKMEKGWGSVYLLKEDLNNDKQNDIVTLTHDWGFHVGKVQISYASGKNKFKDIPIKDWPESILKNSHHYLHKVIAVDIDKDGKKDLVGQINYIKQQIVIKPNIFVLLNKGDHFEYKKEKTFALNDEYVANIEVLKEGKEELIYITHYNGQVEVFKP